MIRIYEQFLKFSIEKLSKYDPIYTLSGGIDSSLIFSYLDNPECFCVQVDGNLDYEFTRRLYPNVIKIEFNNVDIEKILIEINSIWNKPHFNISDMFDYFVYQQFPGRLIITGEEPRFDNNGNDITSDIRRLFFHYRDKNKVDSPYLYYKDLYKKDIVRELVKERLPKFISNRKKRSYSGPNPVFIENHKDQIEYLKEKYDVFPYDEYEDRFDRMWASLNIKIWNKIHGF